MRRIAFGLCAWLLVAAPASVAVAQEDDEKKAAPEEEKKAPEEEKKAPAPAPSPTAAPAPAPGAAPAAAAAASPGSGWSDIIVVPRKKVIKARRVELSPMYGVTINDPMIRHHQMGGQINYYLTDVLWLGVEGAYLQP